MGFGQLELVGIPGDAIDGDCLSPEPGGHATATAANIEGAAGSGRDKGLQSGVMAGVKGGESGISGRGIRKGHIHDLFVIMAHVGAVESRGALKNKRENFETPCYK